MLVLRERWPFNCSAPLACAPFPRHLLSPRSCACLFKTSAGCCGEGRFCPFRLARARDQTKRREPFRPFLHPFRRSRDELHKRKRGPVSAVSARFWPLRNVWTYKVWNPGNACPLLCSGNLLAWQTERQMQSLQTQPGKLIRQSAHLFAIE